MNNYLSLPGRVYPTPISADNQPSYASDWNWDFEALGFDDSIDDL